MKTILKHLRLVSVFIAITFFIQSCNVYHSSTASIDEAVQSNNKIKLVSATDDTYVFEELRRENGNIYGIAKRNSPTAKLLSSQVSEDYKNDKYVKIALTNEQLKEIHLQNKTMSTLGTIAIPVVAIGVIGIIFIAHTLNTIFLNF
ncbi:MAG: hypothetical protein A3F91_01010 [Flavobacteria bacterium RIFCSPLOWO2_12_FULL_35_11]|nr:MAG: hypothetical protein A3F91_01010 [Flavobacteria bacterium RIFCSPLOWO2_12_FULL_35_11]